MTTYKQDDEKICMSDPEHDCQHCSISGRRPFQDMSMEEQDDLWQDAIKEDNSLCGYDGQYHKKSR